MSAGYSANNANNRHNSCQLAKVVVAMLDYKRSKHDCAKATFIWFSNLLFRKKHLPGA